MGGTQGQRLANKVFQVVRIPVSKEEQPDNISKVMPNRQAQGNRNKKAELWERGMLYEILIFRGKGQYVLNNT